MKCSICKRMIRAKETRTYALVDDRRVYCCSDEMCLADFDRILDKIARDKESVTQGEQL